MIFATHKTFITICQLKSEQKIIIIYPTNDYHRDIQNLKKKTLKI